MNVSKATLLTLATLMTACATAPTSNDNDDDKTGALSCEGTICTLSGTITEDLTLTADNEYVLSGGVFFGDGEGTYTLTIEPGTTIYGESATDGFLVIERNAMIMAEGTADAPIVFTSSKNIGSRERGDWGGLIINGNAPTNVCPDLTDCNVPGEAGSGTYGGDDVNDNSGVLTYVRVEFAGTLVNDQSELNGIAFQGVGAGTTLDHIQVHMNADDGVEFFGGTANISHLLVTGVGDDMLDWTDGWTGNAQYVVLQQYNDSGDQGIEADNNDPDFDAETRSFPTLQNLTIIGGQNNGAASDTSDIGILLRHGTAANISHAVVMGFGDACVDVDTGSTFAVAHDGTDWTGDLAIDNSVFWCPDVGADQAGMFPDESEPEEGDVDTDGIVTNEAFVFTNGMNNVIADPGLTDPYNQTTPKFSPDGSFDLSTSETGFGGWFEATDWIGGIGDTDWTAGWTTSDQN
jgi:hypothetical protein